MMINKNNLGDFGRVGVLMGGLSSERAISFKSGKAVYQVLKAVDVDAVAISLDTEEPKDIAEILKDDKIDICFIAMHGRFGEDGTLQEILEKLDMPYTCSGVQASRLSMDKIASREIFKANGLCVPSSIILNSGRKNFRRSLLRNLSFPAVIKPATSGSSVGLSIVDSKDKIDKALDDAYLFDKRVIVEEYIAGRELTVGILNEEPLPIIEIVPKRSFFSYDAKYISGLTEYFVPAELDVDLADKIKSAALLAHKSLNCAGCSRIDLILNKKDLNPYILEVNSIPGFVSTSLLPRAAREKGIDFSQLCLMLIKSALIRHRCSKNRRVKIK